MNLNLFGAVDFLAHTQTKDEVADPLRPWVVPSQMSPQEKLDITAKIEAGEIYAIQFEALVFRDERNDNGTRPEPGSLPALALTAAGKPAVKNHDSDVSAITGTLTYGRTYRERGIDHLVFAHEITDPDEMIAVIREQRKEFSISLYADHRKCSLCGTDVERWFFGSFFGCDCDEEGDPEVFLSGDMWIIHNGFVSRGAVRNTGIISAASFAAEFSAHATPKDIQRYNALHSKKEDPRMPTQAEYDALKKQLDDEKVKSADFSTANEALATERDDLKTANDTLNAARFESAFEKGVAEFRLTPADKPDLEEIKAKMGIEFALKRMGAKPVDASKPTTPTGFGAGNYAEGEGVEVEEEVETPEVNRWKFQEAKVARGEMTQEALDAAKSGRSPRKVFGKKKAR